MFPANEADLASAASTDKPTSHVADIARRRRLASVAVVVAAREAVTGPVDLAVTAADIFAPEG